MSGDKFDVCIIGAGVVGTLTARELSRYGLRILVVEKANDVAMGATKANSAIVHGGYAEGHEDLKGRLCYPGRMAFPRLEKELNFGFRKCGSLVVSFDDDYSRLEALLQKGLANGVSDLRIISASELREREPNVNPEARAALFCEGAGVCSPWDLAIAAMENAIQNGVELRLSRELVSVERSYGPGTGKARFRLGLENRGEVGEDEEVQAEYVINCGGIGAARIDSLVELADYAIRVRSGEYVILGQGSGRLVNSVLFQLPGPMGKGILVASTYHGNLLLGPDAHDVENPDGTLMGQSPGAQVLGTHVERLRTIISQARRLVPGIDSKLAIRSFTGLRAVADGNDFIIGPSRIPGWHRAAGIQSPGLSSAPAIAETLIKGLEADGLRLELRSGFSPERQAAPVHLSRRAPMLGFDEVRRLCSVDGPERMICRCEQVRERDIVEVLSRQIPVATIDGIKRRTRAGMGWCQGQFCRPRVAALLETSIGRPVSADDDVAHSGLHRVQGKDLRELKVQA